MNEPYFDVLGVLVWINYVVLADGPWSFFDWIFKEENEFEILDCTNLLIKEVFDIHGSYTVTKRH